MKKLCCHEDTIPKAFGTKNHKGFIHNVLFFVHLCAFVPLWLKRAFQGRFRNMGLKPGIAFGLLIAMLSIVSSCSIKGYRPITNTEESKTIALHIFGGDFKKALYRTSIGIYGNSLTGLTLIKKTDSATRVVAMSELGMKYFDLEFPFDKQKLPKVHYVMEPLNKKLLVNMIIRDFSLLLSPPEINRSEIMISKENNAKMLVEHKKLIYFFNPSGAITEIKKLRRPFHMKPIIALSGRSHHCPDTIIIDRGKVWFEFGRVD